MAVNDSAAFGTIVSRSYLAYAATLSSSLKRAAPNSKFTVLVVDGDGTESVPGAAVIGPQELDVSPSEMKIRSFIYSVTELATSLKALFLMKLLEESESATFLDPDTYVYTSNLPCQASEARPILLTPHRLTPPPLDELEPSEALFKRYGTFNLGFVSVHRNALHFLDWWESRLQRLSANQPYSTLFTDQRWIDLAPGYFHVEVCRSEGMNIAPWNLDERPLHLEHGKPYVNEECVQFIHFSSVGSNLTSPSGILNSERPWQRVSHMRERLEAFIFLANAWWSEVTEASTHYPLNNSYGFGTFPSGRPIRAFDRRVYAWRLRRAKQKASSICPPRRTLLPGYLGYLDRLTTLDTVKGFLSGLHEDSVRISQHLKRED